MKQNNNIIITVVIALIVGVAAFYGGMHYQEKQNSNSDTRQIMMGGQNGQVGQRRGNFQGTRPVNGEIVSLDANSITVKMRDGSSRIVILSGQTTINKASEGTKADLKTGERVTAFGTANSDGSITAQNVSIGGSMMFRGGASGSSSPTAPVQ
jgi:hypothetical protein